MTVLVRVEAPHFVAGLELDPLTRVCVRAAPILAWAIGKSGWYLVAYFERRGWRATVLG